MKNYLSGKLIILGICISTAICAHGAKDDPNIDLIKARKGEMYVRHLSAGPLFEMAKGNIPYDAEVAGKLANNLKILTSLEMASAWPAGTGIDKYPDNTHALPEIWSTWPKIAESGKQYKEAVDALADNAAQSLEQLRSTIGDLGNACKGCHDDFMEPH